MSNPNEIRKKRRIRKSRKEINKTEKIREKLEKIKIKRWMKLKN